MGTWYMSLYLVLLVILFRCILGNKSPVLNASYVRPPSPFRPPSSPPLTPFESLSKGLCRNISQSSTNVENLYVTFICFNISDRSVYEPWNFKDKIFNRTVVIYINHCFTAHAFLSDRTNRNEMEYNELSSLELSTNHYFSSVISSHEFCSDNGWEIDLQNGGDLSLSNLSHCRNLSVLNVAGVKLSEKDLTDIVNLPGLTNLNLSNTNLIGMIPSDIWKLVNLTSLDLSNNRLTGIIPSDIWKPVNLTSLDLSNNRLTGIIPSDIWKPVNLTSLDLSNNRLTGIIPSDICNFLKLTSLDLSNNRLTGSIPDIWKFVDLESLNLSNNRLIGSIPDLTSMTKLYKLDLSNNNLSGNISVRLENKLKNIPLADLSNNPDLIICSENETFVKSIGLINNCPSSGAEIPTNQNPSKDKKGKKQIVILSVLLPLLLLVLLLLFFLFFVLRKRSNLHLSNAITKNGGQYSSLGPYSFQTPSMTWDVDIKLPISVPVIIIDKPLLDLTFADLLSATNQFDQSTLLSEGRSGLVYCGELRGGFHVTIKVLVQGSFLSDQELASELERLGRIKHPNLVPLIGYCFAGLQRMVIFEYMENGNLNNLLHDFNSTETASEAVVVEQERNISCMNGENYESYIGEINTWSFRHRLAVGIARGLAFLHHACSPQIVHGYVKASSICLDSEFEPRFSDYGLAKITIKPEDENPFGSPGYLSPDLSSGSPPCFSTAQSDVYGFGIVLFEIVTGKKPRDDEYPGEKDGNLVDWVRGLVIKGELFKAIDSSIRQTGSVRRMEEALKIGYLCTSGTSSKRPTMQQVLGLLKDIEPECFGK